MKVQDAITQLSTEKFNWVKTQLPVFKGEYKAYKLNRIQFATLAPRISGFTPEMTVEGLVTYITDREAFLEKQYGTDYNGHPYCTTWFDIGKNSINFGYETTRGTLLSMELYQNGKEEFFIEIPIARKEGSHDTLTQYVLAGATPRLLDIQHSFYCVTEEDYRVYATWWNSTHLGDKLPSWEEYDRQNQEWKLKKEQERLAKIEQLKAAGEWYDGDIDEDCDYDCEGTDIE